LQINGQTSSRANQLGKAVLTGRLPYKYMASGAPFGKIVIRAVT
jgi:hypothetical protein